jgi:predicted TIM-barrel fold metal-dependent hydrolase
VPFWLNRLDYEFEQLRGEVRGRVNNKPSEYFKRQCWVSMEGDEPLAQLLIHPGVERLVFGTDYPHVDHALDGMTTLLGSLSEHARRRIASENPLALYGKAGG